jgi:phosphate transport system protein
VTTHDHEHELELRHHFDDDLDQIREGLVEMGSLVVENTRRAGEAVMENRLDLIGPVREADEPINEKYAELEKKTFEILALQQPVATDLRFLVAATRILYEMERSGDLAVNIVNCLARQDGFSQIPQLNAILRQLVDASSDLFARAVESIAKMDPEAGETLEAADDEVDDLTATLFRSIEVHATEIGLDAAVELNRLGRFLERIADHGVNIAEDVTFVVTAHFTDDGIYGDHPE